MALPPATRHACFTHVQAMLPHLRALALTAEGQPHAHVAEALAQDSAWLLRVYQAPDVLQAQQTVYTAVAAGDAEGTLTACRAWYRAVRAAMEVLA